MTTELTTQQFKTANIVFFFLNLIYVVVFIPFFTRQEDPKYAHLTEEEVKKLTEKVDSEDSWLQNTRQTLGAVPLDQNPSITVEAIREQIKVRNNHYSESFYNY